MSTRVDELHYAEIDLCGNADEAVLAVALFFRCVHGYNREHPEDKLGLDVPAWKAGGTFAGPAQRLRLFGTKPSLQAFFAHPRIVRLVLSGAIHAGAVCPAPSVLDFAAIRRDTAADKSRPSHQRRLARRGHAPTNPATPRQSGWAVPLTSSSTGQRFLLKLKKVNCGAPHEIEFNAYGACAKGAVPQF